jgi:dTDP-4-amino-4,6-dideoxygalactose transaminase
MLTKGAHLEEFERRLSEHLRVEHAICVSSCTSGLMLSYRGLHLKGEVIVPSFTFMATVSSMVWAGLRPVFVDVDPATTNIDPRAVEDAITPRTSAIVAVHNFGNPAPIDQLQSIAGRHGLKLIFDAAHGFGSLYQGSPVGAQGDVQVFSLSPTKLVVAGEGGVVATNDDDLAQEVRLGREYGNDGSYDSLFAGLNARMPEISALIGTHSLRQLDEVVAQRNRQAEQYRQLLRDIPGIEFLRIEAGNRCSYKDFSIVVDARRFGTDRDVLAERLAAEGVDTRKYYDPPVHRQQAYQKFADSTAHLPHTDRLATCSLSLPMGRQVLDQDLLRVFDTIRMMYRDAGARSFEISELVGR